MRAARSISRAPGPLVLLPTLNNEDDIYSRIVLNRFVQHFAADWKAPDTDCREWAGHLRRFD